MKDKAKPADQVLADLRKEWKTSNASDRKQVEVTARKVKMIDQIMNDSHRRN